MGKIKSAIITALLACAVVVLAVFALFSWQIPGSNGVKRYNSFISNIHLGSDLTGNATAVLYPDGVISVAEYNSGMPDEDDEDYEDKLQNYTEQFTKVGNCYVDISSDAFKEYKKNGLLSEETLATDLKAIVAKDAEVLSGRLDKKGYTSYSVAVLDDYALSVSVPTGFTYAEYKQYNTSSRSEATSIIERTIQSLAYNGGLTLRNSEVGKPQYDNILTNITDDITTYFKGVSKYSGNGTYAVKLNLTKTGREQFKKISENVVNNATDDKAIGFYVGDYQLLSLNLSEEIDTSSFLITVSTSTPDLDSQNYSVILNSIIDGDTISLDYNPDQVEVIYGGAELGETASLFLGVSVLLVLAGAIAYSIVRYKKLGLVNSLMILVFALALVTALMLLEIQVTLAGAITAVIGLALMCVSNFAVFEAVRKETLKGKTIQSSVKEGYKNKLFGILEMHVILLIVSIFLAFVGVGEIATCGLIAFITTIASYVLYWFTRFMWYVISSPVKDKFKFCGFIREELEDD